MEPSKPDTSTILPAYPPRRRTPEQRTLGWQRSPRSFPPPTPGKGARTYASLLALVWRFAAVLVSVHNYLVILVTEAAVDVGRILESMVLSLPLPALVRRGQVTISYPEGCRRPLSSKTLFSCP